MKTVALFAVLLAATSLAVAAPDPAKEVVVEKSTDDNGRISIAVYEVPRSGPGAAPLTTEEAARAQGLPIYGATPALPNLRPSAWAQYRPSSRPSRQIEHTTSVVTAGYLR